MRSVLVPAAVIAVVMLTGCTSSPPADTTGSEPPSPPAETAEAVGAGTVQGPSSIAGLIPEPSTVDGSVFEIGNVQAHQIGVLIGFIADYNRGDVGAVMARLAPDARWSDCDYAIGEEVQFDEVDEIRTWLTSRAELNDTMRIASVDNGNEGQFVVLGVSLVARENDALREGGFVNGVRPELGAVVQFTDQLAISSFTAGGPPPHCDPEAGMVGVPIG